MMTTCPLLLLRSATVAALIGGLVACSKSDEAPAPTVRTGALAGLPAAAPASSPWSEASDAGDGIVWKHVASDADVDAAFATARAEAKPVFVYWGAKWCPPCNQVKATLFNRQDFIERSRAFVPVYVDGDSPGAQKLGARFHVSGYPTMLLFSPRGEEVTRLPGEVDPGRYTEVLNLGMNAARPVKAVLADALAGGRGLHTQDWRLLSFYSFETDEQQLLAKDKLAPTLGRLADACPPAPPEIKMRLRLKALAATEAKAPVAPVAVRVEVLGWLADAAAAREEADQLINSAAEIVRAASAKGTLERRHVLAAFDTALQRLEADLTLSRADRVQALIARVDLARIDLPDVEGNSKDAAKPAPAPHLPAALVAEAREQAARMDREINDAYERQAVITAAAYLLERAGLSPESDALLESNLAKSHSPYYLMSELASNARKRGDKAGALRWYREAFEQSEGPATRLQWGASYIGALVDLAPSDEAVIERTTLALWSEAAAHSDALDQRNGRSLQRIGKKLQAWSERGAHAATMAHLRDELAATCAKGDRDTTQRTTCASLLTPTTRPGA